MTLGAVYASTLLAWLDDQSEGGAATPPPSSTDGSTM